MEKNLIRTYKYENKFEIEEIVKKYSNYVYKIITNMSSKLSDEDIEEIASDVFLAVWNNRDKMKIEMPIEPYIAKITRNLVKNKFRNQYLNDNIEKYVDIISESKDIELLVEQKEKNKIIKKALDAMKEDDRNIFILFYYYSKTISEIAKEMQITEVNVKTKLHRIRKKIKKFLEEGGYSYGE